MRPLVPEPWAWGGELEQKVFDKLEARHQGASLSALQLGHSSLGLPSNTTYTSASTVSGRGS